MALGSKKQKATANVRARVTPAFLAALDAVAAENSMSRIGLIKDAVMKSYPRVKRLMQLELERQNDQ